MAVSTTALTCVETWPYPVPEGQDDERELADLGQVERGDRARVERRRPAARDVGTTESKRLASTKSTMQQRLAEHVAARAPGTFRPSATKNRVTKKSRTPVTLEMTSAP